MKVFVLTEGGGRIGMGHISRCAALQEELSARGAESVMYTNEEWNGKPFDFLEDAWVIVDSYLATDDQIAEIGRRSQRCIFIDDNRIRDYPKGIVVNPSVYGHEMDYPVREGVKYLLGKDYVILRKPFRCSFDTELSQEIRSVVITIGGTDPEGLTVAALRALRDKHGIIKHVVISPASPFHGQVTEMGDGDIRIHENLQAGEMRELLSACDLVVSAGGQTVNELIQLRIPAMFVQVADNQRRNLDYVRANTLGAEIPRQGFEQALSEHFEMMDYPTRKRFHESMSRFDFSRGVERIIDEFVTNVVNLTARH